MGLCHLCLKRKRPDSLALTYKTSDHVCEISNKKGISMKSTRKLKIDSRPTHPGIHFVSEVVLLLVLSCFVGTVSASEILLSTTGGATLGGLTFEDGDVVAYDQDADSASLFFDEDLFSSSEDVDAFHVLTDNSYVLSTQTDATLGGLAFRDGDLVRYDPDTTTASLLLSEDLFSDNEDIDAVHVLSSGEIVLSTETGGTLGGLTFEDGDLVAYNPDNQTASLFFDEDLFSGSEDINALMILANGDLVLSTQTDATLGGITFGDDDLVRYSPGTDTASIYLDGGSLFSSSAEDIDAVSQVPAPATLALLGLGLAGLARTRRGQRIV